MGQETSKAAKPDAEHNQREGMKPAAKTQPLRNGAEIDHEPHSRLASLPRSTSWRSPSPRMQSPGQRNYYRPRRRSISPPPLRRDNTSDRPFNRDEPDRHVDRALAAYSSSPRSPEHARIAISPRSPIRHHPSPPRLSSPPRRSSLANFQNSSRPYDATSPASRPADTSIVREPSLHSPTFNPPVKPQPSLALNERRASAILPADKIEFNGLTDVPTGPKRVFKKHTEGPVGPAFLTHRPHIFIHTLHLPALPTTRKHLAKFVKVSESDILIETNHGWRILFQDSTEGRDQLEKCYHEFHLQLLFREYVLNMQCFPNGNNTVAMGEDSRDNHAPPSTQALTDKITAEGVAVDPASNHGVFQDPVGDMASSRFTTAQKPLAPPARRTEPISRRESNTMPPTRYSPALARADRDDSSSPSVLTTSDTSASKRPKCHICRNPAVVGLDPLFLCTTCPRKYHRRCHTKQAVPPDHHGLSKWQCQRCVNKQVAPRSRFSSSSLPAASPTRPTDPHQKHGDTATGNPQDQSGWSTHATIDARSTKSLLTKSSIDQIFVDSSEANDLVEKEFASGKPQVQQQKGTNRTELVRKKKAPTEEATAGPSKSVDVHQGLRMLPDAEYQSGKRKLADDDDLKARKTQKLSNDDIGVVVNRKRSHAPTETAPAQTNADASVKDTEMFLDDDDDANDVVRAVSNAKSSLEPIPQHSYGDEADESSKSKKKPHKWSGGGADRDIIKNGFESLFDAVPTRKIASGEQAITVGTPAGRSKYGNMPNAAQQKHRGADSPSADLASETEDLVASDREPVRQKGPGPARKRNPQGKCANCQRIIPLNPSGSNTHCTKCKREAKEKSTPDNLNAMSMAEARQSPGALQDTVTTAPMANGVEEPAKSPIEKETMSLDQELLAPKQGGTANNTADSASSQHASGKLKRADQRTACEECRKYHRRCHHNAAHAPPDNTDVNAIEQTPNKRPAGRSGDATRIGRSSSDYERSASDGQGTPVPPAVVKRRSFQSIPKNEYDLGDGWERPMGTYQKLIGMALCSVEGHRMASNDIVQWIADNIKGYKLKQGNKWEDGIRATISMNRSRPEGEKSDCKRPLWRAEPIEPGKKSKGNNIELLAGIQETMLHWDPVLKMPVSPVKLDRHVKASAAQGNADKAQNSKKDNQQPRLVPPQEDSPAAPKSAQPEEAQECRRLEAQTPQHDSPHGDLDADMQNVNDNPLPQVETPLAPMAENNVDDSSDDEPLLRRKQTRGGESPNELEQPVTTPRPSLPPTATFGLTAELRENDDPDPPRANMTYSPTLPAPEMPHGASPPREVSSGEGPRPPVPSAFAYASAAPGLSVHRIIKREAKSVECSVASLFDEWPEYDPRRKPFDKTAKLAEIKARPTKKQRFQTPLTRDPWADEQLTHAVDSSDYSSRRGSAPLDRSTRSPYKTQRIFDPWQYGSGDTDVTVCETWDQFFDLPPNPIPILQDGQLAFRDGTQNDDGTLPRAKVIFKTGYA